MRYGASSLVWLTAFGAILLGAAAPSDQPRPPEPQSGDRELAIVNHARQAINEVYVSASDAQQWGADRLGEATIAPGASFQVHLGHSSACEVDVEIVFQDATEEVRQAVNACRTREIVFDGSGAAPIVPPDVAPHPVTLTNRSGRAIQQVLVSPSAASDWGANRLDKPALGVGAEISFVYSGPCAADIRVVFDNLSAEERRGVDVCADPSLVIEPGWTTADTPPTRDATPTTSALVPQP